MLGSPQWGAFERLVKEFTAKIEGEKPDLASEWETIKTTLMKEGQLRGIQKLMQEVYLQVQSAHEKDYERRPDNIGL